MKRTQSACGGDPAAETGRHELFLGLMAMENSTFHTTGISGLQKLRCQIEMIHGPLLAMKRLLRASHQRPE